MSAGERPRSYATRTATIWTDDIRDPPGVPMVRSEGPVGLWLDNPVPAPVAGCPTASSTYAAREQQWRWQVPTGTVKWFSDEKGFGFVTPDELGKDLFVHHTGIAGDGFKSLAEGAKVSYDAEASDKGPKAVNVRPLA